MAGSHNIHLPFRMNQSVGRKNASKNQFKAMEFGIYTNTGSKHLDTEINSISNLTEAWYMINYDKNNVTSNVIFKEVFSKSIFLNEFV